MDILHIYLYKRVNRLGSWRIDSTQQGLHTFVPIYTCRISANPQSCQVKHMQCRQTHRQVIMDYSVGRETDTIPEVCLSVCVSVYSSVKRFRTDVVGRSIISQILVVSQMASCFLNSSRLLLYGGRVSLMRQRS